MLWQSLIGIIGSGSSSGMAHSVAGRALDLALVGCMHAWLRPNKLMRPWLTAELTTTREGLLDILEMKKTLEET